MERDVDRQREFDFIVLSPPGPPDATVPIAASRAGALGVVDLQFATEAPDLTRLSRLSRGRWGVLVATQRLLDAVLADRREGLSAIVLSHPGPDDIARVHGASLEAFVVASGYEEGLAAEAAGADAVIAKGHEAAGWIGDEGAFVLLQRLLGAVTVPVWVWGGIGLHTVAAAYVAGAAGAVVDGQVLLARESPLPKELRSQNGGDRALRRCLGQY